MRRTRYKHMHMIFPYMTFHDMHFQLGTDIPDDLPQTCSHMTPQQPLAVLRDPYQMILDVESGMRRPFCNLPYLFLTQVVA